ncbi:MAG TPA: hypothetical protein VGF56_14765 [Rhizomicrobium sp.]|jgi:hypothetical protein
MILAIALASTLVYATPLAPPGNEADAARAYGDARRAADLHSDGFNLDTTVEGRDALERRWTSAAEWVCAVLNAHPDASAEELATMILNADNKMEVEPLDSDAWLVVTGMGDFGAFAVVKKFDGKYRPVWLSWRDAAANAKFPTLAAWTVDAARSDCRDADHAVCGPLSGRAALLPADASGHARFYVEATFAQQMGETVGGQTSLWNWDGQSVSPLLVTDYLYMLDQNQVARFDGTSVRIREKQDFKTFSSCGACLGRQVDQVIKIAPDGVRDMGRASVTPELDLIDAAFDRLHRGQPVEGLASPQAVKAMESILRNTSEPGDNPRDFSLGMLMTNRMRHVGADAEICFQADTTDTYIFTLKRQGTRLVIAKVRPDSGTGPGKADAHCKGFRE